MLGKSPIVFVGVLNLTCWRINFGGGAEGHSSLGGKKIMIKLDMFSCLFLGCKLQQVDVFGFDLPKMVLWECSPNYSLQFLFQFAAFFFGHRSRWWGLFQKC